ncbi:reverse transcriptase domain-containing protein, partial [Tanacetum coccineum]
GASNSKGSSAGSVLISPSGVEFTYALRLNFMSTNHATEYEALLAGLRLAENMKVQVIDVKVDSKLVASQIKGSYVASSTSTIKYLATARECIAGFKSFAIQNIPRNLNQKAEILRGRRDCEGGIKRLDDALYTMTTPMKKYTWDPSECTLEQAIDYFTKWIEAKPLARITMKDVKKFVWDNIMCQFGLPRVIVKDNRTQFVDEPFKGWCEREEENKDELHLNMDLLQERREAATIREAKYKTKMEQYYNQKHLEIINQAQSLCHLETLPSYGFVISEPTCSYLS